MNRKDPEERRDAARTECETYDADLAALVDGALDEQAAAKVRDHLAACAACRDEYANLAAVAADLEAIGRAAEAGAPQVDLVDAVMAVVQGRERTVTPLRLARPRPRMWLGLTAAAGIALVCGLAWYAWMSRREEPPVHIAVQEPGEIPGTTAPSAVNLGPVKSRMVEFDTARRGLPMPRHPKGIQEPPWQATRPPDLAALTMADIVRARTSVNDDEQAWTTLMQWATLTPEQAMAVAATPGAVPDALIAAASSLPPEQAAQLLLTLVGSHPDVPCIRLELAKAYGRDTDSAPEEASAQLQAMKELDPDNALPYYLQARKCLQEGDLEGALVALEEARALEEATTYSLEAAASREQALLAAGAQADSAQTLAALTGGMWDYDFLCDLGNDLLQYGLSYVELGDLGSARQILEAVHRLGGQVEEGAVFAYEQLAGLDIQRAVVDVLSGLYQALESTVGVQDLQRLTSETVRLVTDLEGIRRFFESLDRLFAAQTEEDFWRSFSAAILQVGDLMAVDQWTTGSSARATQ